MSNTNSLDYCKSCNASIAFLKTKNNKIMPVDISSISTEEKTILLNNEDVLFQYGKHISHFFTCPNAELFRKSKSSNKNKGSQ